MAKRLDLGYARDEREAIEKFKRKRTADCVVGGFRCATNERIEVHQRALPPWNEVPALAS
jgi:ATP-dependent DNA ligase